MDDITVFFEQRWIKKKNYRKNHAKRPQGAVVPTKKVPKLTPWQIFLKQFGDSDG